MRLFGRMRRCVVAGDRVDRQQQTEQKHHETADLAGPDRVALRLAGGVQSGIAGEIIEGPEPREIPVLRKGEAGQGQHDRCREDEIAGEICQLRRQPDAIVIDQRLDARDEGNEDDLVAKPLRRGRVDADGGEPGGDCAGEESPGADIDGCLLYTSPSPRD